MSQKHYAIKASVNQHSGVRGLECLAHSEGARRKSMAGGNPFRNLNGLWRERDDRPMRAGGGDNKKLKEKWGKGQRTVGWWQKAVEWKAEGRDKLHRDSNNEKMDGLG